MKAQWKKLHDMKISDAMFSAVVFPELLKLLGIDPNTNETVYIRNALLDDKESWLSADGYEINWNLMYLYEDTVVELSAKDGPGLWYSAIHQTKELIGKTRNFKEVSPVVGDVTVFYTRHKDDPLEESGVKTVKNIELGFALRKNK